MITITIEDDKDEMFDIKEINNSYGDAGLSIIREEEKRQQAKIEVLLEYIKIIEKTTYKPTTADYAFEIIRKFCQEARKEIE